MKLFYSPHIPLTCRHQWLQVQIKIHNTWQYLWPIHSLLTFLYPDNATFLEPYNSDTKTYSVVKLFHQRVGSYFSKKGDKYEARWVKGIFTIMTNPHLMPLDIITCYPVLTYDKSVHLKPYNKFHNPKFQPTFDYIDFCTKDYNFVENNYDQFY